jgi:hypothetical protein
MPSKQCLLPSSFGVFSHLPPSRIDEIRFLAERAARAWKDKNEDAWRAIIAAANLTLSKHERGVFSAFAIVEAGAMPQTAKGAA